MAAGHGGPVVPKFGSWDADNIGYTVFFDKVRENKTAPTPAPKPFRDDDYDFDPYEHYDNLSSRSRPASSHGSHAPHHPPHHRPHLQQHHHHQPAQRGGGHGYHRRNGSNGSSAASEVSSRASKFSPPKPYQPRYSSNDSNNYYPAQHGGGGGGAYAAPAPRQQHHHSAAPRVAAASPPRQAPPQLPARATKAASAVPKFGVWDEQNAAAAGQGFTVQFEKVKRHREVASAAAPDAPPELSPERVAPPHAWRPRRKPNNSFLSKVNRCLFPRVRE